MVRSRSRGQGAQRGCIGTLGTHTRCPVVLLLQPLELVQVGLLVWPPPTPRLRPMACTGRGMRAWSCQGLKVSRRGLRQVG